MIKIGSKMAEFSQLAENLEPWFEKVVEGVSDVGFSDHPAAIFTIFWGTSQWFFPIDAMQNAFFQTTPQHL